jgi:hypothetical protein
LHDCDGGDTARVVGQFNLPVRPSSNALSEDEGGVQKSGGILDRVKVVPAPRRAVGVPHPDNHPSLVIHPQ